MNEDAADFSEVYRNYAPLVRRVMARLLPLADLDDGVQEVFIKIHRHLRAFRGDSPLKSWVYRICINTAQDFHRSHYWRKLWQSPDSLTQLAEKSSGAEEQLGNHQLLARGLEQLSMKERSVLVLFYWEDQKIDEIAANLNIPEGTVKSRLSIARHRLQNYLKREGDLL